MGCGWASRGRWEFGEGGLFRRQARIRERDLGTSSDTTREAVFPGTAGETAELIRAFDWSRTELGPIEGWPQSLKTITGFLLASPMPIVLLWGTDGYMIYNDAYSVLAGGRHPELLGSKVREGWPEVADFNDNVMKVGLAGGTLAYKDQELTLYRHGGPEQVFMNLDYSPVPDESGKPAGVIAIVVETTAQVAAARYIAESEERFQLALSAGAGIGAWDWDVTADLVVADERFARLYGVDPAKAAKGAPLAEFFRDIHPDDTDVLNVLIAKTLATGESFYAEYRLIQPDGSAKWVAAQGRAIPSEDGKPLRFPGVSFDITERKADEDRNRALLELDDHFRTLDDSADLAFAAAETLGRTLNVSRVGYGTIDPVAETITIERDWNAPGIASLAGVLHFRDYGSYIEDLKRGETVVFADAEQDPRTRDTAAALKAISAQSLVNMPVTERDGLVALLYLNHATAREWPQADLDLVREVANRTRMAVERRRAEEELRALNAELERKVIERTQSRGMTWQLSPDLMGVLNAEGYFEASNPAWETVLGWSEREMAGFNWRDLVHPEDRERSEGAWADAAGCGLAVIHFENRYRTRSGAWRWLQWVAVPEDNKVYFTTRDVTVQKAAEAERKLLAELIEQTDTFIQVADRDFNLLAINQSMASEFEQVYGVRPKVGDNMLALLGDKPEHQADVRKVWSRALDGEEFTVVDAFGDPSLNRRHYEIRFNSLRDSVGQHIGAYQFVYDVTERLQAQAQLEETQEALRQSQKMEAVGQLTGGIAHDFNNLLTGITGSLDMIEKRIGEGKTAGLDRYITAAQASARRAASLTQRLLAFSRRQTLDPKPTDVNRLISGMADLIRRTVGPAMPVEIVEAGGLWLSKIDPSQLENALLNLAINARDAMPEGGRITVETANKWLDARAAKERELRPGSISRCA